MSEGTASIVERIDALDWRRIARDLAEGGWAATGPILTAAECAELETSYDSGVFRSTIAMGRHGFGSGEYRYFAYPLPSLVAALRETLYKWLEPVANGWQEALGREDRFPPTHAQYIRRCHAAGQTRPTPLVLRYGTGDYNRLHQDVYGELTFPLQAAFLLSRPGEDFEGGEFVLTEQRPRMQSRAQVVPLARGEAVLFAVRERPVAGSRGTYRATMRHGVSTVRLGRRHTMGVILHDAP